MKEDRRIADRVNPKPRYINVYDRIGENNLGSIANLSETGFMLVSDRTFEPDSVFQLELNCCEGNYAIIQLGAICLWNAETSSENLFWAGFQIIDISDQAEATLKQLISDLNVK